MRNVTVATVAVLVGLASAAQAATLVGVSGQILVNRGHGFELAQPGLELKPGDLVVANPGASAQIAYPEGCVSPVLPGLIASIATKAPCAPLTTGALPLLAAPLLSAGALTAGGAIAGGGALAYALAKNGSSNSASASGASTSTAPPITPTSVPASP